MVLGLHKHTKRYSRSAFGRKASAKKRLLQFILGQQNHSILTIADLPFNERGKCPGHGTHEPPGLHGSLNEAPDRVRNCASSFLEAQFKTAGKPQTASLVGLGAMQGSVLLQVSGEGGFTQGVASRSFAPGHLNWRSATNPYIHHLKVF